MSLIKKLTNEIYENGFDLPDSNELVCKRILFENASEEMFFDEGTNVDVAKKIIYLSEAASRNPGSSIAKSTVGRYMISDYVGMFKQLSKIATQISDTRTSLSSRRFVIEFRKDHCFLSIHFLIRNDTVIVCANMRSCNLTKNFLIDAFLLYYCGVQIANVCNISRIDICMFINSLHIMKEGVS